MLDAGQWQRLSALLDEALDRPAPEREAWLAALQASEPATAAQLRRMLAEAGTELDEPGPLAPGFGARLGQALQSEPPGNARAQAGERLGAWALVRLLGEGGMGEVWLAERADGLYSGRAAIKLLRADITGPGLAARFARERALLGRLTHPGIARLLDAGEQDGRAYLVLEQVSGQLLGEHVRARALGLTARVRLLLDVARAVEHAHAQLIVHRDLKPSNVMVDDAGQTKLLDFGIAGLLDPEGAPTDGQLTQLAGRRLTPAYAAPEQILGGPIGVAADVYSLGVMLFELASGHLPFGVRGGSRTQLEHAVLHTEAPRITQAAGLADASVSAGPGRPADAHRARGDLEAVAAKAMRKSAAERYASVGAFIEDLQCWLDQRPVSVRAEDWRHRLHLWARRNAAVAVGGTLVLATLSAGLAVSLWQRNEAQAAARQSEAVTGYLTELLGSANPDKHFGRIPNVFELLEKSRAELNERFKGDPLTRARVLSVMAATYSDMNRHDIAIPLGQDLIALSETLWGADSEPAMRARQSLARSYTLLGSPLEVIAIGERVLPQLLALGPRAADDHLNMLYQLIVAYGLVGRFEEAEAAREQAWPMVQARYPREAFEYGFFHAYVYNLRMAQGRLTEAEAEILATRPSWATAPASRARFVLNLRRQLWTVQSRLGRPEASPAEAERILADLDALLGPGSTNAYRLLLDLARHFDDLGDHASAVRTHERLAATLRAAAADHPALRLPRESAALLSRVLAGESGPQATAQVRRLADDWLASGHEPSGITGPPWVEAGGAVLRSALVLGLPDLAERVLAPMLDLAAHPWLRGHAALRARIGQWQGEIARERGELAASVARLREQVDFLDALPPPQGLPHWRAQLDLGLSLARAGDPGLPAALARADTLRPPWLGEHPLDGLRRELAARRAGAGWSGRF